MGKDHQLFKRSGEVETVEDLSTRSLSLRAATVNEEERSVEAILSTEAPVQVLDWSRYEIIDEVLIARGVDHAGQVPMLENHMRYSLDTVLGSIRNIRVEGNKVIGRLFFAKDDEAADRAWNKVKQGHVTDVSVGYRALVFTDISPNSKQVIEGREFSGGARGLRVTTKWQMREGSLTPIGADQAAKIRSERQGANPRQIPQTRGISPMNKALRDALIAMGMRSELTDEQAQAYFDALTNEKRSEIENAIRTAANPPAAPAPAPAAEQTRAAVTVDADAIAKNAIADERKRVENLRALAGNDVDATILNRAINEGLSVADATPLFLENLRKSRSEPAAASFGIHVEREANVEVLAAGLVHRCGLDPVAAYKAINPHATDATRKHEMEIIERGFKHRNHTFLDLCRLAVRMDGGVVPEDRGELIQRAVSGSTLTNMFTTSVNARVLLAYAEAPDTTSGWVRETDVADFKTNERIGLGKTGSLEKLARGDNAKHATFSDIKEEYKIARYAKQFVIDEQDIIDDNLGMLAEVPMEMGMAAGRLRPDLVYSILIANANLSDGAALFVDATHGNLLDQALDATYLKQAITKMKLQRYDGVNLNLTPSFLIASPTLEWTAKQLINSAMVVLGGTAGSVTEKGASNPLGGYIPNLVFDARLENGVTDPNTGTAYSGAATKWYLAASPNTARTIEVGYLSGSGRRPRLRSFTLDKGSYGLGWDINFDIGAKALDYRGLVRGNA